MLALFDYWLRLLRFDGIKADDEALQELAAQVADAYGRPLAVCETHMRAVLQARFGQTPVSEEQRQAFQQEVSLLAGEIYQKQSRERKLLFKYWFALY